MPVVGSRVLFAPPPRPGEAPRAFDVMRVSQAPPDRPPRAPHAPLAIALGVAWIGLQGALILTASQRADAVFGFRMFAESSTIRAHLAREVDAPSGHGTIDVPVKNGGWVTEDRDGKPRRFRWQERVIESNLDTFDREMHASYSAACQIDRWHAAVEDVVAHLDSMGDATTRGMHLTLVVRKNGGEPVTYDFTSERAPRGSP